MVPVLLLYEEVEIKSQPSMHIESSSVWMILLLDDPTRLTVYSKIEASLFVDIDSV